MTEGGCIFIMGEPALSVLWLVELIGRKAGGSSSELRRRRLWPLCDEAPRSLNAPGCSTTDSTSSC